MTPNEITPAQKAMLDFCSSVDANTIYHNLHTTLGLSIANFSRNFLDEDARSSPSETTIEAWYSMLTLLQHLHDVAVEDLKNVSSHKK